MRTVGLVDPGFSVRYSQLFLALEKLDSFSPQDHFTLLYPMPSVKSLLAFSVTSAKHFIFFNGKTTKQEMTFQMYLDSSLEL